MRTSTRLGLGLISVAVLAGCGGGGGTAAVSESTVPASTAVSTAVALAYPTGLATDSPTATLDLNDETVVAVHRAVPPRHWVERFLPAAWAAVPGSTAAFEASTERINALLGGAAMPASLPHFKPQRFMRVDRDADCYGPQMKVSNSAVHPDTPTSTGAGTADLPTGDLGLWDEKETASGHACAVAQLNHRMHGVSARSGQALMALAILAKRVYATSGSLPAVGASADVTSTMPAVSGVTWSKAVLSQPSSGTYLYLLQFDFTDASGAVRKVDLDMTHTGSAAFVYTGLLKYAVTGTFNGGNCPGTGDKAVTRVGTLKYGRTAESDMSMVHRSGQYCGSSAVAGSLATDRGATYGSDGQLNPASKFDSATGKGWGDNFSRFGATLNPSTRAGSYQFAWQAGYGDGNSRMLQIALSQLAATKAGAGYFGFGLDIAGLDGTGGSGRSNAEIQGMICNWAGPGNSHVLQPLAQKQTFTQAGGASVWTPAVSNIRYAPANTCTYAGTGLWYDRDRTGLLTDETSATQQVSSSDATYLLGKGSSASIGEAIAFTAPSL